MHRRRRRRASLLAIASLLSSCSSTSHEWITSVNCPARCGPAALRLVSPPVGECVALTQTATTGEWRVALEDATSYHLAAVALSPRVRTLELHGNKTRVMFDAAGRWTGERLTALLFIGLDLTNTSLPALPSSLTRLQIVDCVLNKLPATWLLSMSRLETLVLANNTLADDRQTLIELSEQQFKLLSSRLTEKSAIETEVDEAQTIECLNVRGGRVQRLSGHQVCVVPDEVAVARRLQTSADSGSDVSQAEDNSDELDGSSRSSSSDDDHTPTLVLLSMGLPFVYFLYKVALYIFFMRTYNRSPKESKNTNVGTTNDSEQDRPTANESTTSPPASPSPRVHRKQDKQPFSSNNAGFWVDEELQPWRLDFQRLKMLKCLNLLPSEKRQTLRKQSVTSAMNPREIWLASLAPAKGSAVPVSPGGGTADTLVVAKFLALKDDQGPRSSSSGNGGGGASDKLKSELKRQAVFSHPQVELMSYSAVGSGRWISPEALLGRETSASYPDASDVYSFGILIAEMDSHELPFSDLMQANRSAVPETDILQLIARGALSPTLSPACPKSIVKLVNACTSYKPKYRPSSTQVQQDLLRILEDFRAIENNTTATISVGAPRSNPPSNLV
ncbi:hypothetical protein PC122_g12205 [Phytophthora cactorum]|nr:hypothetical protein PC122_g12205 [Phytophthora cactorum]